MKKILGIIFIMLIMVSATKYTTEDKSSMHTIEGTWELQNFYQYDGQNVIDTTPTTKGYRQVKMYYNGKIMWSRTSPAEKKGRFGYGTYKITPDRLIEQIEYGDWEMMQALDTIRQFTFELILEDETYSQIQIDEMGNRVFSENYKRID
ncbi:hypothetical protein [Sediminicola luteus]|uniref:Lipocalin-like domain-containing protein n=1 Tax=Sediminicola luteus TaxID=319238 RepID=A0ABV2TRJ2_9FLAO